MISRQAIIDVLAKALAEADYVLAAALGGSDATGRTDQHSDIDLQVIAEDERVEDVFALARAALEGLGPIELSFRLPEPAWHGLSQEFLRLRDSDPNHILDLAVIKRSKPPTERLLERERHGESQVLFDRGDFLLTRDLDWPEHIRKVEEHLESLRSRTELFQPMVSRAVARGHRAEAATMYQALTLKPLVELLRIRHCPERHDYGFRYLDRDLPEEARALIERLSYPHDAATLECFRLEAMRRFRGELAGHDAGEWRVAAPLSREDLGRGC